MKRFVLTTLVSALVAGVCFADVPPVLNHQGMLTDAAGMPLTGDHFMTFRLYDVPEGGTELWGETQRVSVNNGVFNVYLGEVAPLDDGLFVGQDIWLGVTVESDGEMTPRLRLGSVLYAFTANNAAGTGQTWYLDGDGDGFGNFAVSVTSFIQPEGYVANGDDCDDDLNYIYPGAEEFCDGLDYNCDGEDAAGLVGPPCSMQLGVCQGSTMPCGGSSGWLPCGPEDYGSSFEVMESTCDGLDNDCDGIPDNGAFCDDFNPCTADYCSAGICIFDPQPGNACNDGDPCTVDDICDGAGNCIGSVLDCNDNIECTIDYCDNGCVHELQSGVCLINGQCFSDGQLNPLSECQECNTAVSVDTWTNLPNATLCSGGQCDNGVCIPLFR